MLASMDDERPTILRRLMSIENKVDTLIERGAAAPAERDRS
jgi:hypothetical protein